MPVFFNGRLLVTPTVASRIDDTEMANHNLSVPMNLAIIGQCDNGAPKTVLKFGSPVEARQVLQSGELLMAVEKAFAPSSETFGPQYVYAFRVDPATKAQFCIPEASETPITGALQAAPDALHVKLASGASASDGAYNDYYIKMTSGVALGETNLLSGYIGSTKVASFRYPWKNQPATGDSYAVGKCALVVESTDYGRSASRVKFKVEAGASVGKCLTTSYGNSLVTKDNLAATYFTLKYDGAADSCVAVITGSSLTVKIGTLGSEVITYVCDFLTYDTVSKVVDFLDAAPDLTAAYTSDYRDFPVYLKMDYSAGTAITKSAGGTNITANLQAIVNWLDSYSEPYITAYRPVLAGAELPANVDWQYLTGGVTSTPTTQDWQDCFDLLQQEDVQCVIPLSGSASVHSMAEAHCEFMSNQGAMERRTIVGGVLGETIAEIKARAFALNGDRVYLVAPGFKAYNTSGVLVTYAPYMLAAYLGGMICGCDPGTSLTNKSLNIEGLETSYRNPTDTDELINGGVAAVIKTKQGYKIAQSVSTWLVNRNYNRVEMATGFAADYVSRNVREALRPLIGAKGTPHILIEAVSRTENALKELARPAPLGPEVIVGDAAHPAFKNITASLDADVLRVEFECSPVVPVNYILIGINTIPYSGTYSTATVQ